MKRCSLCKLNLDLTAFVRDKTKKDGHHTVCRECTRRRNAGEIPKGAGGETFEALERRRQLLAQGLKDCAQCKETKVLAEFSKNKANKDGLQKWCTPCRKVCYQERYRDKVIAQVGLWQKNNRDRKRKNGNAYVSRYPEKMNAAAAFRRSRLMAAVPEWAKQCPQERAAVQAIYHDARLISKETGIQHHVDHIIPLAAGGLHISTNLQVIPAVENLSKGSFYKGVRHKTK